MKIIACLYLALSLFAATPAVDIQLHSGDAREQKGKDLILEFLDRYDLEKYIFTNKVIIQSKAIPHSHPVLTLNTRHIHDPDRYFSTFIHEQLHWYFSGANSDKTKMFVEEIKKHFPDIPNSDKGGAKNEFSTYLHLGVCYYEYMALKQYLGEQRARHLFETSDVYTWINKQVLDKGQIISETLKANDLNL